MIMNRQDDKRIIHTRADPCEHRNANIREKTRGAGPERQIFRAESTLLFREVKLGSEHSSYA